MKKDILNTFKILLAAIVLSLGISYVYAWTAPTLAPPGGNVEAPINSGLTPQTKKGSFTSNGNIISGGTVTAPKLNAFSWISTPYLAANNVAVNNNITANGAITAGSITTTGQLNSGNLNATNVYTNSVTATGQVRVGSVKFNDGTSFSSSRKGLIVAGGMAYLGSSGYSNYNYVCGTVWGGAACSYWGGYSCPFGTTIIDGNQNLPGTMFLCVGK